MSQTTELQMGRHWLVRFIITLSVSGFVALSFLTFIHQNYPDSSWPILFLPLTMILSVDLSDLIWSSIYDDVTSVFHYFFKVIPFILLLIVFILINPWDVFSLRQKLKSHLNFYSNSQIEEIQNIKSKEFKPSGIDQKDVE